MPARKIRRRVSNLEVSDFIVKNGIKNVQELFAQADACKQEGKCDLAIYLFSRSQKILDELVSKSMLLKNASATLKESKISRMDKVH